MLAATEADFQLKGRNFRLEQASWLGWRFRRQVDPVLAQAAIKGNCLLRAYRLAVPTAEEAFGRPARSVLCIR